jgi:tetratricopeptide (TPR) repeat protein
VEIIAKKNLFNTKTFTKFIVKKADIAINTNNQPIKVIAGKTVLKNIGTEFETVKDKEIATSVYKGKIKAKKHIIKENQGLIVKGNKVIKTPLPSSPKNVNIYETNNKEIIINWESPYKKFVITLSVSKNFDKAPILKFITTKHELILNDLEDGLWYFSLQSEKNNLFSIPYVNKFLYLKNYYKALKEFKSLNIDLAEAYVKKSLKTIKTASDKPYILYAKILLLKQDYKKAIHILKKAKSFSKNNKINLLLAKTYYKLSEYKKALNYLTHFPETYEKEKLIGLIYYHLNNYKQAKKYLFKVLEINPHDKIVLNTLLNIFKKENNKFLIEILQNKLRKTK